MYERSRHLMDCHIAGFNYYDGLDVIEELKLGTTITLKSEPENLYDQEAVAIYYGKAKLGYIPQAKNRTLSNLIYFGHGDILEARVNYNNPQAHAESQFRIVIKL
ncbi:HIRAN domain-containing protein [Eubacteriales bacterium OttesenSCG-928-K08]|nr:HIRAN domain-containing protein [Eubacteriales bacterium OttesenSCG-928-K08]